MTRTSIVDTLDTALPQVLLSLEEQHMYYNSLNCIGKESNVTLERGGAQRLNKSAKCLSLSAHRP